jgi:AbiTii-like protein
LKNRQAEALTLSEDLLADIELVRMPAEQILLKAIRLARLIGDESTLEFLQLELHGYQFTSEARRYLKATGRLSLVEGEERAYLQSLGEIEASIRANETKLKTLGTPSLSGDGLIVALRGHHANINAAAGTIASFGTIRSAVIGEIHSFASRTYYELTFSEEQASLFDSVRREIDGMLAPLSGSALQKIESIMERLNIGEEEATSQAMNTCRRLIDSFADAVHPPQDEPAKIGDQQVEVKKYHVLNRIDVFVHGKTASKSRRTRLRQAMRGIYDRVSTGVHSEVTASEARFLFLETYVVLGEIVALGSEEASSEQRNE